jgi:hypothetical protein
MSNATVPVAGPPIRWLQAFQVLLIIFQVVASIGSVILLGALIVQLVTGLSMPISFEISRTIGDATGLPQGHSLTGASEILIDDPTLGQLALWLLSIAVPLAVAMIVSACLIRVVQTAIARNPFSSENLGRVRLVGLLLLFGGLAASLATMLTQWAIARISLADEAGDPMIGEVPFIALAGVVVLAIAEVMRQGATLRAELDEVV